MEDKILDLIGAFVEVETGEMSYEGKLIEVGEKEVQLESRSGWIVIPIERVVGIRKKAD